MTTPPDLALATAIRHIRHQAGLSQERLAVEANITTSALARIERSQSNPTWTTIRAITNALNIDLHQLATTIETQKP